MKVTRLKCHGRKRLEAQAIRAVIREEQRKSWQRIKQGWGTIKITREEIAEAALRRLESTPLT